ncbi:MAG: DUF4350 domain-containing protein [Desulfuromonadales bacterium]|nr:DUF4350 domain-containing protein [Desulfuromonadales bacterium]
MTFFARILLLTVVAVCYLATYTIAAPIVLFDESHAQQFVIDKSGPLDLSELAALYQDNGFNVLSHADGLTKETLGSVDVLVISGPFLPLSESELDAVIEFINAGGGLAIMLHIAPPVRDLLHRLDVDYTNGTLRETSQTIDGNPLNFKISIMADHPVTAGLNGFSIYGAWALRGTAPHATIIAATSQYGWVDLNRDNQLTEVDAMQTFGVMVAGETGQGRYVVLGDDAVFQNRFLDEANRQLALKLVNWLGHR